MSNERTPRLTRRQAAIIGAFTGVTMEQQGMDTIKELAEEVLGRPVWTHEYASPELMEKLREAVRPLLAEIVYDEAEDAERVKS